jgi:antitoxin YefM
MVILVTISDTASIAEAKAHLSELVARVGSHHERVTVTVHGRPTAVLMAIDDLEAMEETIAVLSDASVMRSLAMADAEVARGEGEDIDALHLAMRARRGPA